MKLTKSDWIVPAALIALSAVPSMAGTARIVELARGAEITSDNARFFAVPLPVILHICSVVVFSMLGAFQFSDGIRTRYQSWHRKAGRLLVASGLLTSLTGL